jgi:poly(3-hydroxyalkanoate) synthetase
LAQTKAEQDRKEHARNPWDRDLLLWPFAGAMLALDLLGNWLGDGPASPPRPAGIELAWTSPNTIALELATMRLRDFSSQRRGGPVLVCAPYAVHGALIADFAPEHSIVAALQRGGHHRVYLTDWRSARPEMRYLTIDDNLSDLNVAIDEIGPPVDLVGLCQGGWLALLFAARFPNKVRRLVLAGTPVDVSVPSALSQAVAALAPELFESMVDAATGIVSGRHMLDTWHKSQAQARDALQLEATDDLLQRFEAWNTTTVDLPGTYYLNVVNAIFRENRIAAGHFIALGRRIDPAVVTMPVFLLAGTNDEIVPAAQALATASLVGTPATSIATRCEPSSHLGLFMGRHTIAHAWRQIAQWLATPVDAAGARPAARARPG